ncbi:MAG TPA: tRNA lysidine(34) synthetase TilS [Pseudolabrys sp.]|nr:tRNA lysidine(34) synthetase TilS [Pseudolabrys sp.]
MSTAETSPVSQSEAKSLFSGLEHHLVLVLAVSGGPDSTALMLLASRWSKSLKAKPKLVAVTVDHGLRKEAKREAAAVAKLARKFGIAHKTLLWSGKKPATGLQQAARAARYRLMSEAARKLKAAHILTAHTLDDQAETVIIRMSRGSGLRGLAAMQRLSRLDGAEPPLQLVRPLLELPKARLIATLKAAKISYADDPSNRDPRFTRARLRTLMPELAKEGLTARRLAVLAQRLRRADRAIEVAVEAAVAAVASQVGEGTIVLDAPAFARLPAEIALRLMGRAVDELGDEGPVELAKLESLNAALKSAQNAPSGRFRRSLAGALVTLSGPAITVERAPARRGRALTKRGPKAR